MATYASWRVMQLLLFAMGLTTFISVAVFLPETSHPGSRGIDKLLEEEAHVGLDPGAKKRRWRWVWLNPFGALALLRGPNVLLVVSMLVASWRKKSWNILCHDRPLQERSL
jgi:hypothetical protein